MNNILNCIVLLFISSIKIHEGSLHNVKLPMNLIHNIHGSLQETINTLFDVLYFKQTFINNSNSRVLLSMHAALKTIAENRFAKYKMAKKLVKVKRSNTLQKGNINLERLIHIVLEEKLAPVNADPNNQGKESVNKFKSMFAEIPESPEEAILCLKEYLYYIEGLEAFNFTFTENNTDNMQRSIKTWQASSASEEIYRGLSRRVFDGKPVQSTTYPFIASIHVLGYFKCSGSIVLKDWILTAASCVNIAYNNKNYVKTNPGVITIRTGGDYIENSGGLCTTRDIVFHPKYNPETLQNNLAMIRFKNKQCIPDISAKIKKIVYSDSIPDNVDNMLLLGWAKDSQVSVGNNHLSATRLNIYQIERCKKVYSSKFVTENNFCAGYVTKGSGACQHDIGGPGIVQRYLAGVVSFAPPTCGTPDAPTVFTNISLYTKWIDNFSFKNKKKSWRVTIISTPKKNFDKNGDDLQRLNPKSNIPPKLLGENVPSETVETGNDDADTDFDENIYPNNAQTMVTYPQTLTTNILRQLNESANIKKLTKMLSYLDKPEKLKYILALKQLRRVLEIKNKNSLKNLAKIATTGNKETTRQSIKYLKSSDISVNALHNYDIGGYLTAMNISRVLPKIEYLELTASESYENEKS